MITGSAFTINKPVHDDVKTANELVYNSCGFELTDLKFNLEGAGNGACSFLLNGYRIQHRVSNITPKKTGQFVSIWKRNKAGITEPYDISDDLDFIIITSRNGPRSGQFIFPKLVLADKGIITQNGKEGKRGIRVYPPWDSATNKQAAKTQRWQTKYFIEIKTDNSAALNLAKKLLTKDD